MDAAAARVDTTDSLAISVALAPAPSLSDLEQLWLGLEANADPSFFTSWSWLGCWLRGLSPSQQPQLLQARRAGNVVGLALLVDRPGRRLRVLPMRGRHLHATGDPVQDEITIEHNGLLVHRHGRAQIERAMYAHLLSKPGRWDQLLLPGLSQSPALQGLLPPNMALREHSHPTYVVDLNEVRKRDGDYLGMLSSNTRQQIRRSVRAYEGLGPLTLTEAPDLDTALSYLSALRGLHEKRWRAKGEPGVFSHPGFEAFHQRLIAGTFATGAIQLLRVRAGAHDVGYLYSFVHRGRLLFYQSGLDYELLPHHGRPGFVTHMLAVQHNASLGAHTYDLLSGSTRYKLSLASSQGAMVWSVVHRKTLGFHIEESLRHAWRRWQTAKAAQQPLAAEAGPTSAGQTNAEAHAAPAGPAHHETVAPHP